MSPISGSPGELLRKPVADRFKSIDACRSADPIARRCRLSRNRSTSRVSALALQFVNDLPGVLAQIRRALKPDGLLLAAMIGGDTLTELRQSFAAAEAEVRRRRVAARRAVRRSARYRRAVAARGICAAGDRCRPRRGALRQRVRADGTICGAWARPIFWSSAAARRPAAPRCCGWRRSTASVLPIPTAASARPSTSSGCPAGRRMRASRSR